MTAYNPSHPDEIRRAADILLANGLAIYPVGGDKKPIGQWSRGARNYVLEPATPDIVDQWCTHGVFKGKPVLGWAVLSSTVTRTVTLDVETPGMDYPQITRVFDLLPDTCQQASRRGGRHAYLRIGDGDMPSDTALAKVDLGEVDADGKPKLTMLAEVRRHSNYAVIHGPGRPQLPDNWQVHTITRDDYETLIQPIRDLNQAPERKTTIRSDRDTSRDLDQIHPIARAIATGDLSPLAVLPDRWEIVGTRPDGAVEFLRDGAESDTTGNVKDGVFVIHSTSVEWARDTSDASGGDVRPAGMLGNVVLAEARYGGDYKKAMQAVEQAAADAVDGGLDQNSPFASWPLEVLADIHHHRQHKHQEWLRAQEQALTEWIPPTAQDDNQDQDQDQDQDGATTAPLTQGWDRTVPVGQRLAAERLLGEWMYVNGLGWAQWDGRRWRTDVTDDHALAVAAAWCQDWIAGFIATDIDMRPLLKYRDISVVRQVLAAAKTDPRILATADQLDQAPGLLNVRNGTIDLRTGELLDHDPNRLITRLIDVDYHRDATHPDWDKALAALPTDARDYLRAVVGSAATGEHDRGDPVVFHHGLGANGKTTILGTLMAALGDYATLVPDSLLSGRSDGHPTELMPLRAARLALLEELPEDHLLPVARIKKITDTATITARLIGRDFITWRPTHALMVSTNYHPIVAETDHGTWRRLVMVDYPNTYSGGQADPTLKRRLRGKAQQAAVLAWIVAGARHWYDHGQDIPTPPKSVHTATEEWRDTGDPLATWLRDTIHPTKNADDRIPLTVLLDKFTTHQQDSNARPWSMTKFSSRLKSHRIIVNEYLGVDRGSRKRDPTAVVGAALGPAEPDPEEEPKEEPKEEPAQGAQGQTRGSQRGGEFENLWDNPAHPAQERETDPQPPPVKRPDPRHNDLGRVGELTLTDRLLGACDTCGKPAITSPCSTCRNAAPANRTRRQDAPA